MYEVLTKRSNFTVTVYDYLDHAPRQRLLDLLGLTESEMNDRQLINELGYKLYIRGDTVFFNENGTEFTAELMVYKACADMDLLDRIAIKLQRFS